MILFISFFCIAVFMATILTTLVLVIKAPGFVARAYRGWEKEIERRRA